MTISSIIRILLVGDIVFLASFALLYLRQRKMSPLAYFGWGILAVAVPVIGPFVVIASRPGCWNPSFSFQQDIANCVRWLRRLFPDPVEDTARMRSRRQMHLH